MSGPPLAEPIDALRASAAGTATPAARKQRVDTARLRLLELDPTSTLKQLLTATLDLAEELTGSQIGFFHFVDDDQSTLWLQAWSTNTVARMCTAEGAGAHYPVAQAGVWADCVRTGKAVVHDDYASLPGKKGMPAGHAPVVRELVVPVTRGGRICAVLGVGNKASPYDDADVEDVSAMADLAWDVAARKRAQEALAISEARFRRLFESMRDGMVVVDMAGTIVDSNEAYRRMLGYTAEELATRTYVDLTPERWHGAEARIVAEQVLPRGHSEVYEKEYRRKDGTVFPVELRTVLIRKDDRPEAMWAIVRDVTERRRAADALRAAADYARNLLEASLDPLVTISPEGKITDVNAATEAATGVPRDRLVGTDFADAFTEPEKARAGYQRVLAEGAVRDYPLTIRHVSGRTTEVRYNATIYANPDHTLGGVFAAARDVTEVRALEAQLSIASRLAALGTLVAGVAHEVNNPLAAALADLQLALPEIQGIRDRLRRGEPPVDREAELRQLDEVLEELTEAREAARRIAHIVRELKVFAEPRMARAELRLSEVVAKALRWVRPSPTGLATVTVEDRGAPPVLGSFGQLEQVVVNLVTNAMKATRRGQPNPIVVRIGPGAAGGARLDVVDQGTGIAPELLPRVFDPFFTTSEVGKGKGLGLAVCHSIVVAHGGMMSVESRVGSGTTFRVELPAAPPYPPA